MYRRRQARERCPAILARGQFQCSEIAVRINLPHNRAAFRWRAPQHRRPAFDVLRKLATVVWWP